MYDGGVKKELLFFIFISGFEGFEGYFYDHFIITMWKEDL